MNQYELKSSYLDNSYLQILNALNLFAIVSITDKTGIIQYANSKFCDLSGYTLSELVGQNHRIINSGFHDKIFFAQMWNYINQGKVWQGVICNRNKNGNIYWVDTIIVPIIDDNNEIEKFISIRRDITSIKETEIKLSEHQISYMEMNNKLIEINNDLLYMTIKNQNQLEQAELIQKSLLPSINNLNGIYFNYIYIPSLHVSGDILNYFTMSESVSCFYILDVCGHGIAAAMMSYSINKTINQIVKYELSDKYIENNENITDNPDFFVKKLNDIYYDNSSLLYFSIIFGFINKKNKTFSFCQAGHPNPIHIPKKDSISHTLGIGGFPVGILPTPVYDSISIPYEFGDRLYLYSDGVIDCQNISGESFSVNNLKKLLEENHNRPLDKVCEKLERTLFNWTGSQNFNDDASFLCIELF